jgi:hypothetical protein
MTGVRFLAGIGISPLHTISITTVSQSSGAKDCFIVLKNAHSFLVVCTSTYNNFAKT